MSKWWFWLVRLSRRMLVRASLYGLLAVAAALAAVWFAPFVPAELARRLGGPAVGSLLSALASSLLAVATFSLSTVVVAYTAAAAQVTPRAASFVTADGATQRALATFVGAFLFAVVALVALGANYYGPAGRTILFLATLLMVAIVAATLLGWIDRLLRLAQYGHLLQQIEQATRKAMSARIRRPYLGGMKLEQPSERGFELASRRIGYIANVDPNRLHKSGEALDCTVEVLVAPGDFVSRGQTLARLPERDSVDARARERLESAFTFSEARTYEQDPRYGLEVLVEAAARALSPGVNDPRTAVLVVDACYRLLAQWVERRDGEQEEAPTCARVKVRELDGCDLIALSLGEIGRYGAGDAMVAARVQAALKALTDLDGEAFSACARRQAMLALRRAEAAISFEPDLVRVREAKR
jgi:uncharacterized membrane protein